MAIADPVLLPPNWRLVERVSDGAKWVLVVAGAAVASVICSVAKEHDGHEWIHASIGRADRMPTYEDVKLLKDVWLGPHCYAVQVFPPASKHVNIHPYVLHLFSPVDPADWPLPDFTQGGKTL